MATRTTTRTRQTVLATPRKGRGIDVRAVAVDAIDNISEISKTISLEDKDAAQFCRALRSVLWTIKGSLEKEIEAYPNDGHCGKKTEGLLSNLERLCSWPSSTAQKSDNGNRWPTLRSMKFATGKNNASGCIRRFAADKRLSERRSDLVQRLRQFDAKIVKAETAQATQIAHSMAKQRPAEQTFQLDDDIKRLFTTLEHYSACRSDGTLSSITTNIRLNGYRALKEGTNIRGGFSHLENMPQSASAEFGLLFRDHPHTAGSFWQEACVHVCPMANLDTAVKAPRIRFADEKSLNTLAPTRLSCENFCDHISSRSQDLLRLSSQEQELYYHTRSDISRNWLAHHDAMTLTEVMSEPSLNLYDKSKSILEFLLAKATWQFYSSDSMQGLTSDNVLFLHERRLNRNGVFVNEPMLLTRFDTAGGQTTERPSGNGMIHDQPKILALGILLLELETRKTMSKHRENPIICPSGPVNINTDYKIASILVDDGPNADPESILDEIDPRSPLKWILPLCIKSGRLRAKVQEKLSAEKKINNSKVTIDYDNALRSVIHSEIVHPLEQWANKYDDLERVKPLCELREVSPLPQIVRSPPIIVQPGRQIPPMPSLDERLRQDSRTWFDKYESLMMVLQPLAEETDVAYYHGVKIAVLDTGLRKDGFGFDYLQECEIPIQYVDLVDGAHHVPSDNTGHGSAAVTLLLKMCPNASIHVAKVLRNNYATSSDVATIVKGIDWAISQEADIISMAIGFESEQQPIVEAINRAHARGIFIFSAASNSRNVGPVYCPAIMTDQVFGMFSTNAGIRESQSLNPSPRTGADNFAIFGEGVEIDLEGPLVRGTSYSTSIGSGLAAALLDFSRQNHGSATSTISKLKGRHQMKRVLLEMSKLENNYDCIRPWKLLSDKAVSTAAVNSVAGRNYERDWIRGTIERLMQPENLYAFPRR